MNEIDLELPPGSVLTTLAPLTEAVIRPYLIAVLLHRGRCSSHDLISTLIPHCDISDLKTGEDDRTRLEALADSVIDEFLGEGLIEHDELMDDYVLTASIGRVTSWCAALNAEMPAIIREVINAEA